MSDKENSTPESEALFSLIEQRYGDRLDDEQTEELREVVEGIAKNADALKSVKVENGLEPFSVFTPYRRED